MDTHFAYFVLYTNFNLHSKLNENNSMYTLTQLNMGTISWNNMVTLRLVIIIRNIL